jgi:hypothetical protein
MEAGFETFHAIGAEEVGDRAFNGGGGLFFT